MLTFAFFYAYCDLQQSGTTSGKKKQERLSMRQLMRQRNKESIGENETAIDRAQVGVLIQCVCGLQRALSLLANKEEVGENKTEVA